MSAHTVDKLAVEGLVIADRAVVKLELGEADSAHFNTSMAGRRASLRVQIVHEHILIVGKGVLWVTIVQSQISTIVLAIS